MFLDSVVGVSLIWRTVIGLARVARGVGFGFLVGFVQKTKAVTWPWEFESRLRSIIVEGC